MAALVEKYCTGPSAKAKFLTIYIDEAHAVDGWYLPTDKKPIYNHKTLSDRIAAAKQLQTDYNFPGEVVCDSMKNEAAWRYLAMPERLFIIQDGFIVYHGGKGPFDYNLDEVEDWLAKRYGGGLQSSGPGYLETDLVRKLRGSRK